jgi:hypothetical protein
VCDKKKEPRSLGTFIKFIIPDIESNIAILMIKFDTLEERLIDHEIINDAHRRTSMVLREELLC